MMRLVVAFVLIAAAAAAVYARPQGARSAPRAVVPVAVPIGVGDRFQLAAGAAAGSPLGGLRCTARWAPVSSVHVELFANRRALLLPAGIGVAPPRRIRAAVVTAGRCRYPLVTLDPTGTVRIAGHATLNLADLFRVWNQPLSSHRLCGFRSPSPVRAYLNGRPWHGAVGAIPLRRHDEIVVEIGAYVPPHSGYLFPEGV